MAQPLVSLHVPGRSLRAFRRQLDRYSKRITASVAPQVIGEILVEQIKKRMANGVDADGVPFSPLSEETLKWRRWAKKNPRRAGYSGKGSMRILGTPLMFSKRLHDSIRVGTGDGVRINTGFGFRIVADAQNTNTGDIYGHIHQSGGLDVPQRRFMEVNTADADAIAARMKLAFETGV